MAKFGSVMKTESVDVAWVSDVPISVNPDGFVEVDIVIVGARERQAYGMNERIQK
jgi:hypothetical protein